MAVSGLPWPSGHGPIEADCLHKYKRAVVTLPWPSGHGPIEALTFMAVLPVVEAYFRGLRVTAPLKQVILWCQNLIFDLLPWPSGHGPIEAQNWL